MARCIEEKKIPVCSLPFSRSNSIYLLGVSGIVKRLYLLVFIGIFLHDIHYAYGQAPHRMIVKWKDRGEVDFGKHGSTALRQFTSHHNLPSPNGLVSLKPSSYREGQRPSRTDSLWLFTFPNTVPFDEVLEIYRGSGLFEYVEPDYTGRAAGLRTVAPNDPGYGSQWYLRNDGSFSSAPSMAGADIDMEPAWEITRGDTSVIVAILDSGINPDHREFSGRFWQNAREQAGDGQDNDRNGYTDDTIGWDFVNEDADPRDDGGHGTAVTGILAATGNNNFGYAGIDWHCRLMIGKVVGPDLIGFYSDWIRGIYYAVDHGADIINFSLVGDNPSRALEEAVNYAFDRGTLIVASMGNNNTSVPVYPARYARTFAIGATDPDDTRSIAFNGSSAFGSNYGDHLDVVAPGNYILGLNQSTSGNPGSQWSGTSMSSPVVAGIAALLRAQNPSYTPAELTSLIMNSAEDEIGDPSEDSRGWDIYYGFGRVNALRALQLAEGSQNIPLEDQVDIFPNPATSQVNFRIRLSEASPVVIEVISPQGAFVSSFDLTTTSVRNIERVFDVRSLPNGMYLARIRTRGGEMVRRFVKY